MSKIGIYSSLRRIFTGKSSGVEVLKKKDGMRSFGIKHRKTSLIIGTKPKLGQARAMKLGSKTQISKRQSMDLGKVSVMKKGGNRQLEGIGERLNEVVTGHRKARLQNAENAFNRQLGLELGNYIIGDDGKVDMGKLNSLDDETLNKLMEGGKSSRHKKLVKGFIKRLKTNPKFQQKLESIGVPKPENKAGEEIIRSTLGLRMDHNITDADSRRAVISTFISDLRQGNVGSCFTTAAAIQIRRMNPEMMLDDMKSLVENGFFTKKYRGKEFRFNITQNVLKSTLDETININRISDKFSYMMTNEGITTGHKFKKAPGILNAMKAIGIESKEMQQTILDGVIQKYKKGNFLSRIFSPKKVTVGQLIKDIVMERTGVNKEVLAKREKMLQISEQIKDLNTRGVQGNEINQLIDKYDQLNREVGKSSKNLTEFDTMLRVAENRVYSQTNNKLLRSWEYSLAAAGRIYYTKGNKKTEGSDLSAAKKIKLLNEALFEQMFLPTSNDDLSSKEITDLINDCFPKNSSGETNKTAKMEFTRLISAKFRERLGIKYEEGAFTFYEKDTDRKIGTMQKGMTMSTELQNVIRGLIREIGADEVSQKNKFMMQLDRAEKKLLSFGDLKKLINQARSIKPSTNQKAINIIKDLLRETANKIESESTKLFNNPESEDDGVILGEFRSCIKTCKKLLQNIENGQFDQLRKTLPPDCFLSKKNRDIVYENRQTVPTNVMRNIADSVEQVVAKPEFLKRVQQRFLKIGKKSLKSKKTNKDLGAKVSKTLTGGSGKVINQIYFGGSKIMKDKRLNCKNAEHLGVQLIQTMRSMAMEGMPTDNEEIMIPVSNSSHSFSLLPGMDKFKEAIASKTNPKEWLQKNIIENKGVFVIADSNWESGGEHRFLALKGDGKTCKLVTVGEAGNEMGGVDAMGTKSRSMDQKAWVDGQAWDVVIDPNRWKKA